MKTLVIGAGGFVGPYLIESLKKQMSCDIVATILPGEKLNCQEIKVEELDISNPMAILSLLLKERPEYIVNLAAHNSIWFTWDNPGLTVDTNIKGSINILDAVRQANYEPSILLIGSGEEYGKVSPEDIPISEDVNLNPCNIYGATKACQDLMAEIYVRAYKMKVILARAFNYIGPGQSTLFVISDFAKQIAEIEQQQREPVIQVGNLDSKRDFLDVRDLVRAYTFLLERGMSGEVYNIGSGQVISIREILNLFFEKTACKVDIQVKAERLRPIDVPVVQADVRKIIRETGWKPQITLEQSIEDMLQYWRKMI